MPTAGGLEGGVRAMALSIFEEWRLAHARIVRELHKEHLG